MITKDTKISKMLAEYPQTLDVLINYSPHFSKLNNKILRKTLASRVNVEQAAGIAGVNLILLLNELNKSVNSDMSVTINEGNTEKEMTNTEKPEILKNINNDKIKKLDVRPIIDSGKDPFLEIMAKVKSLSDNEVLHLINSFEPIPLYSVLEKKGFDHWTEKNENVFDVFFFKTAAADEPQKEQTKSLQPEAVEYENIIELDVRQLVPPEPMMKILENISKVDDKTVMIVHHHREPIMLYPKLEERGYTAVTNKIEDNYYKVVITKIR
ncbi:MAG: DUF2249 domain-containing protein [Ignavibacteriota bacterium]|nr:DUF2249 domain-containing protein [Ignavibacteriota bacterium]MCO6447182.1 DUF2249 domain-containing protein [Ignavibacterium album]MCZ2268976.1 DUF2249 domain-containing protein [Ignavibacteriales bacterium]HOJ08797.1 DUF2249 domain-containing protein [Ignavibacteriaceae bacterium]MEB2355144.1 DUF2249 domain-containing protein [Ignavibacteriales bacterium]